MSRLFDDALNQNLQVTGVPVIAAPFTMSVWFNSDSVALSQTIFWLGIAGGGPNGHYWQIVAGGAIAGDPIRFRVCAGNQATAVNLDTTSGYSANTWHNATGVEISGSSRSVYIDGEGKNTDATAKVPNAPTETAIGYSAHDGGNDFSGAGSEAAIWNVALTDAEVMKVAQGFPPWLIRPNHFLGFWLPMGHAYRSDRDFSRSRNHMTATNAPTWFLDAPKVLSYRQRMLLNSPTYAREALFRKFHPEMCLHTEGYVAAGPVTGNPWYAYAQQ